VGLYEGGERTKTPGEPSLDMQRENGDQVSRKGWEGKNIEPWGCPAQLNASSKKEATPETEEE